MSFIVKSEDKEYRLEAGEIEKLDLISTSTNQFHLILNEKTFDAEVINEDLNDKTVSILINGHQYDFKIEDELDQLIQKMGYADKKENQFKELKAPMPGLILDIMVSEGQEVKTGDPLLILEAMKMENIIKASGDGKVKDVRASIGATVEKNEIILEMI